MAPENLEGKQGGSSPRYPAELREQARALRSSGHSVKEISVMLGVSEGAVGRWTKGLGTTQAMASAEKRAQARRLRAEEGLSIKDIATRLGMGVSTVSSAVESITLSEEQQAFLDQQDPAKNKLRRGVGGAVANKENANHRRAQAREEGAKQAALMEPLHLAGCMLYWGEGGKGRNTCRVTNSDAEIMRMMMRFFRKYFTDHPDSYRVTVDYYTNNGLSAEEIQEYWKEVLDLPFESFYPFRVDLNPRSQKTKRVGRLPYGVCHITVKEGTDVTQHIFGALEHYGSFTRPQWHSPQR